MHQQPTCFTHIRPTSVIRQQAARIRLNIYAWVTVCTPNTLVRTVDCLVNTGVHSELIFYFFIFFWWCKRSKDLQNRKSCKTLNCSDTWASSRRQRTIDSVQVVAETSNFCWRCWICTVFILNDRKATYFLIPVPQYNPRAKTVLAASQVGTLLKIIIFLKLITSLDKLSHTLPWLQGYLK